MDVEVYRRYLLGGDRDFLRRPSPGEEDLKWQESQTNLVNVFSKPLKVSKT